MMSRALLALSLALTTVSCIEDQAVNRDREANGGTPTVDASLPSVDGAMGSGGDAASMTPPEAMTDGTPPVDNDARPTPEPEPEPPPTDDPDCNAFCERIDTCLLPACPGLEDVAGANFCAEWCEGVPPQALQALGRLECREFVEVMFREADDLEEFCEGERRPPDDVDDQCDEICEFAAQCGVPERDCRQFCNQLGDGTRACLERAERCEDLEECIEGGGDDPPDGPPGRDDLRDACEPLCGRQAQCVIQQCAPGSLPGDYVDDCARDCERDPPDVDTFRRVFRGRCDELIGEIRDASPEIDGRCEAQPDQACANLCADLVVPCGDLEQAECVAQCEGWDEANFRCVSFSDQCREVNDCFGDAEGQQRCQDTCDYLQECLLEACPPRIISPEYRLNCAAGCLDDPPSERETEDWLALSCADVRGWIYQRSRELRPLCEGNQDFRPSVEECAAFCDNVIGGCPFIGGRNFCLNGCASLTRDQYGCAVERQGDCDGIAACLADPVDAPGGAP